MRPILKPDEAALALADRSNQELYREVARRTPGARIEEGDGLCLVAGVHPSPIIVNTAFRTDPRVPATSVISRAEAFYAALGRRFGLMTNASVDGDIDRTIEADGWRAIELPGMVLDRPTEVPAISSEVEIAGADPLRDLAEFRSIVQDGFAEDDEGMRAMIASAFGDVASISGPLVEAIILRVGSAPAAAGLVMLLQGVGVVSWIATIPAYRRRGLGAACTAILANRAFELGASRAGLQASAMGFPIYERLGFRTVASYRIWIRPRG